MSTKVKRQRGTGLETRHVFLDTQVYHSLKHNPANPAFKQLMSHVGERRLALHICDITLLEVKRQLHETVASRARELALVEKDLKRWRAAAPRVSLPGLVHLNVEPLSKALFDEFCGAVLVTCRATMHRALDIHAKEVFDTYFGRYPPFDREGSKEFPDGFVLKALEKWSEAETTKIYVVSADRAVARAAEKSPHLIPIKDLHSILNMATAQGGAEADDVAEAVVEGPGFEKQLGKRLKTTIKDAVFVYTGDLPEGEAYEAEFVDLIAIREWTVIGRAGPHISLVLKAEVTIKIDVQFEDRSGAAYDSEDGIWLGAEVGQVELETEVDLPVFVELNTETSKLVEVQVLDEEVSVTERYEDFF